MTLKAQAGGGEAFMAGEQVWLSLTDGTALNVAARGGNKRVTFGDVPIAGSLASLTAKAVDLVGTLSASGALGNVTLGAISGAVAAAGPIFSVAAGSFGKAKLGKTIAPAADDRFVSPGH